MIILGLHTTIWFISGLQEADPSFIMTKQDESERIAAMIGNNKLANLPKWIHDEFDNQGECTECGDQTLCFAPSTYDTPYVCYTCGTEYTDANMPEHPDVIFERERKEAMTDEEIKEENIMKRKEAQLKSKQRLSMALILLGILFCLTIIGLPVGAVLIYLATRIAPDPEDI